MYIFETETEITLRQHFSVLQRKSFVNRRLINYLLSLNCNVGQK